jgi:hypothetical protein
MFRTPPKPTKTVTIRRFAAAFLRRPIRAANQAVLLRDGSIIGELNFGTMGIKLACGSANGRLRLQSKSPLHFGR